MRRLNFLSATQRLPRWRTSCIGLELDAGHLSVGIAADVCVFDPEIEAVALKSQGKNAPFLGLELQEKVRYIIGGWVGCLSGIVAFVWCMAHNGRIKAWH